MKIRLANATYTALAALIQHPHRLTHTYNSQYTGSMATSMPIRIDEFRRKANGLARYLNTFAERAPAPHTFTLGTLVYPMPPMPICLEPKLPITPHINWNPRPQGPPQVPFADGPVCQLESPWPLAYWNASYTDETDATRQHEIALTQATIDYFVHISRWFRIPARSQIIVSSREQRASIYGEDEKSPQRQLKLVPWRLTPTGSNPNKQYAIACIEALALKRLLHPLFVAEPYAHLPTNLQVKHHNDYKHNPAYALSQRSAVNDVPVGTVTDSLHGFKSIKPIGALSTLANALTPAHINHAQEHAPHLLEQLSHALDSCPPHLISIQRAAHRFDQLLTQVDTSQDDFDQTPLGEYRAQALAAMHNILALAPTNPTPNPQEVIQ